MAEAPDAAAALGALRADLLAGRFGTLDAHLSRLEALEAELAQGAPPPADLAALRAEAQRVAGLLSSAGAGVRAALRRLRDAASPAQTYGVDGRRTVLGGDLQARGTRA